MEKQYSFDWKQQNIVDSMFLALNQAKNSDKCAVKVSNQWLSYQQLKYKVFSFAKRFQEINPSRICLLGSKTLDIYEFLLASLVAKITYVPLNPKFIEQKNAFIINHSESDLLVICSKQVKYAKRLLLGTFDAEKLKKLKLLCTKDDFAFLTSDFADNDSIFKDFTDNVEEQLVAFKQKLAVNKQILLDLKNQQQVFFISKEECFANTKDNIEYASQLIQDNAQTFADSYQLNQLNLEEVMHILYTSGTTGDPKGVMITYGNFSSYFYKILDFYQFNADDVFSNFPALTFDISLQDLVCALHVGATVVCPTDIEQFNAVKFIDSNKITVTNTVPYIINLIDRMHLVRKPTLNTIRISIFIGEPLWTKQVALWHKWFPKAKIYNTYGPTETTVAVSYYEITESALKEWSTLLEDSEHSSVSEQNSIVSIGKEFNAVDLLVLDDNLQPVSDNVEGMLYIAGEQVTKGYFKNPIKQQEAFVEYNGSVIYKTGDYVKVVKDKFSDLKILSYIGRNDDMLKISGVRMSIYDIDEQLSMFTDNKILALVYENPKYHAKYVFAAVEGVSAEEAHSILLKAKTKLKNYIQPIDIFICDSFPLNANGKVDRKQLYSKFLSQAQMHF